jgi:hypothetical protein
MSYEEIVRFYPNPRHGIEEIMPTRLGNILRNAELYPYERYNIRSVTAWPRLFPLLPAGFSAEVVIARSNLNFMLIISSLSAAFACVAGGYLLFAGTAWWFIVAWIAYRGALSSALFVGTQIKVAFDLYRNELLKQMRVTLPTNSSEEKQTWRQLHQLFYQFKPLDLPYTANLAPPSSSSSEETDP